MTSVAIGTIELESSKAAAVPVAPATTPLLPTPFFFFRESFEDIVDATDEGELNCVDVMGGWRVSCLQGVFESGVTVGIYATNTNNDNLQNIDIANNLDFIGCFCIFWFAMCFDIFILKLTNFIYKIRKCFKID